jgi:hypothetical protein
MQLTTISGIKIPSAYTDQSICIHYHIHHMSRKLLFYYESCYPDLIRDKILHKTYYYIRAHKDKQCRGSIPRRFTAEVGTAGPAGTGHNKIGFSFIVLWKKSLKLLITLFI